MEEEGSRTEPIGRRVWRDVDPRPRHRLRDLGANLRDLFDLLERLRRRARRSRDLDEDEWVSVWFVMRDRSSLLETWWPLVLSAWVLGAWAVLAPGFHDAFVFNATWSLATLGCVEICVFRPYQGEA